MADGNLVHESSPRKGAMVFGPDVYNVPLLPYERELIKTIGITEEEYQLFAAEVRQRGRLRPAEYEHVPNIVNGLDGGVVTGILINLAISLVLTGVAYLLTPKPKMPSAAKRGSSFDTGSITGPGRFNPTRGFETLNELADYASPVPIIFGLYQGEGRGQHGGGVLVTPKLVWSRMFSYGTQQSALLMFVVGEQGVPNGTHDGIAAPGLEGIFLGNNALDPVHEDLFAFYWSQATTTPAGPRIKGSNLVHGTQGSAGSGNPNVDTARRHGNTEDIFLVPSIDSENSKDFCHAYSPANSAEFGAYSPIANGNGIKVNYNVIPIGENVRDADRDASETKKSQRAKVMQRVKIVGDQNAARQRDLDRGSISSNGAFRGSAYNNNSFVGKNILEQNQAGTGRQYSPRMGIISVGSATTASGALIREVNVNKGDEAVFLIHDGEIPEDVYQDHGALSVKDINSLVLDAQISADEQMQLGEIFAIGGTLWKVTQRRIAGAFKINDGDQRITLECIDTSLSIHSVIGIVDRGDVVTPNIYIDDRRGVGCQYYPITKLAVASFKNNRPASVTEIGIKSTVFQRLNNLAAINALPVPAEIEEYGRDKTTVTTGTANIHISRASAFRIAVKKADSTGNFVFLNEYFVVIGSKPVAQYNSIQIKPNFSVNQELEFKIIPIPGGELRKVRNDQLFVQLKASPNAAPMYVGNTDVPNLGLITVNCPGLIVDKTFFADNAELLRGGRTVNIAGSAGKPSEVEVIRFLPQNQVTDRFKAQSIRRIGLVSTPSTNVGASDAFSFALAGDPDQGGPNRKTTETTEYYDSNTKFIKLRWSWVKVNLPSNHYARVDNGQRKTWAFVSCAVIDSSPGFPLNHEFEVRRGKNKTNTIDRSGVPRPVDADYGDRNPFKRNNPGISDGVLRGSGCKFRVTETSFSQGGDERQAYFFEKFGAARDLEINERRTVVLTKSVDGKAISVNLIARVVRLNNDPTGEQKGWGYLTPQVRANNTDEGWQLNDVFEDLQTVAANNPFGVKNNQAGARYAVRDLSPIRSTASEYIGENFEFNNGYADISFYRDLIKKSNENEPEHQIVYVNEIVPNDPTPSYSNLTTTALSLKASRAFGQLDQMRCWLGSGLKVKRLHPRYAANESNPYENSGGTYRQEYGPSHLFTDLVYYLLTDQMAGAGGLLNMSVNNAPLVDIASFRSTSVFLERQKLFFNGVITEKTNVRQFVTDLAPYFLCNFVITDGKFGLVPALPFGENSGRIDVGSVTISQLFTSGNILEDSFSIEYLRSEERRPFVAVARYRGESKNKFPEEKAVVVFKSGARTDSGLDALPQEDFDFTQFCTSKEHAEKAARYFLAIRELVTHTVKFSTTVFGLNLKAGSFIKVITECSPYSSANNGTIDSSGNVTSVSPLADGQYNVFYYTSDGETDVRDGTMTVSGGKVTEATFHDSVFTLNDATVSENVYVVEQLTFSQEGTVDIVASEHPCKTVGDTRDVSELALAVVDTAGDYMVVDV